MADWIDRKDRTVGKDVKQDLIGGKQWTGKDGQDTMERKRWTG
jgi:hypothetical protein